jgi:hypothetical protein
MTRFRLAAFGCAAVLATALGTAGAAGPAQAVTGAPRVCPAGEWYVVSNHHPYFVVQKKYKVTAPGGTWLQLNISSGTKVTGVIHASGSYSANDLISKADAKIDAKIAYTKTASSSVIGRWKVPKSWSLGWFGWGSWGYEFNWQRGHYIGSCKFIVDRHGTAKLPAKSPGFDNGKGEGPTPVS